MRARSLLALVMLAGMAGVAHGGPKQDIQSKVKEAMEQYDSMEYDAAKKLLEKALSIAKKAKLDNDKVAAKAHLSLGIILFVDQQQDAAKEAFLAAVKID